MIKKETIQLYRFFFYFYILTYSPENASGSKIPDVEINNPLSKRNIKHIQTRHNVDSIKSQVEYLSDAQLAEKLKYQSFLILSGRPMR